MQFNASGTGLYQDSLFLVGVTSNDFLIADFTRLANRWYYNAVIAAWEAQSDWEFDDINQTGLPSATTTLVASQEDYQIPTNALKILRVEVKDSGGNWRLLQPFDETQIHVALDEFEKTAGLPKYYRLTRRNILLKPAPDSGTSVTLASGLKLHFLREVDEFTSSDTSQEPGLGEPFHRILSLGAAYDFAIAKGFSNADRIKLQLDELMANLKKFYTRRHRNFKPRIRPLVTSYR